ncbi:putative glutamate transporter [Ixodes scapularis]
MRSKGGSPLGGPSGKALEESDATVPDKGSRGSPKAGNTSRRSVASIGPAVEMPSVHVEESHGGGTVYENMFNIAIAVSVLGSMVVGLVFRYASSKPWTPRQVCQTSRVCTVSGSSVCTHCHV